MKWTTAVIPTGHLEYSQPQQTGLLLFQQVTAACWFMGEKEEDCSSSNFYIQPVVSATCLLAQ